MSTWAKTQIPAGTPITANYVYTDEANTPLYKKERYEWQENGERKKMFKLRGFAGYAGGKQDRPQWDPTLDKNMRRVPYHLPQLRAAIMKGEPLYIVDGEKDVETLEREGYVATTTPMGTMGVWRSEWAAYFYGASRVTIIADNDVNGKGLGDAWRVADSLRVLGIIAEVKKVPVGKDVSDYFATRAVA